MEHHVKHAAHEGHSHMDHANMNHTAEAEEDHSVMEHDHHHHHHHHPTSSSSAPASTSISSLMDHSSHAGHNHAGHNHGEMMHGAGAMCKMDMYWNWYTIDACFLSKSWHITSAGMFAGSCIGIVFLVVLVEALRRCAREWDRHIVRDWKERAMAAAEGVDVDVVDAKGNSGIADSGCCSSSAPAGAAEPASSSSEKGSVTKLTAPTAAVLPTKKRSFFSRLCPYTSKSATVSTPRPTLAQHLLKSLIYAVLLGVGYILMLLAMYYNGYIFFCLVIGAWLGNFLFGMDTCVLDESIAGAERGCGC
ncbi:Copper Transporter integral membrane protein that functions in high affinity copper transport [Orbilia blumenaviensis]|uniref:Copper transport protein n=1 Tax=Orbilia blumenaviensis TaxID=1796055 RepID=A0AAV9U556_9PEZI